MFGIEPLMIAQNGATFNACLLYSNHDKYNYNIKKVNYNNSNIKIVITTAVMNNAARKVVKSFAVVSVTSSSYGFMVFK